MISTVQFSFLHQCIISKSVSAPVSVDISTFTIKKWRVISIRFTNNAIVSCLLMFTNVSFYMIPIGPGWLKHNWTQHKQMTVSCASAMVDLMVVFLTNIFKMQLVSLKAWNQTQICFALYIVISRKMCPAHLEERRKKKWWKENAGSGRHILPCLSISLVSLSLSLMGHFNAWLARPLIAQRNDSNGNKDNSQIYEVQLRGDGSSWARPGAGSVSYCSFTAKPLFRAFWKNPSGHGRKEREYVMVCSWIEI